MPRPARHRSGRFARRRLGHRLHQAQYRRTLPADAQRQRVAHKMHLAALPHRALKMPLDSLHHALMIVAHDITHAAKSALLQLNEDRAPTGFRLTLGHPAAYIRKIHVDIGDRVYAGQLLAELEVPEMTAQVEGAQAVVQRSRQDILSARSAVARAAADYAALHAASARLKQASDARPGLIAQQELDDAEAKDLSAKAQVDAAQSELASREQTLGAAQADHRHYASLADYSRMTAPFDVIVTWRYADTGSRLQAGTSNSGSMPAIKLAQVNILRLRLPVPESLAGFVHIGDTARIHMQATGEELIGKVVRTTGELDLATRSLQVEIDLDNKDGKLTPGMYADVTLDIQRSGNELTIPVEAVDRSQSTPFSLVVDAQGRIEKRTLSLGMETPRFIEVIDGLHEGERVDGQKSVY